MRARQNNVLNATILRCSCSNYQYSYATYVAFIILKQEAQLPQR